MYGLWPISVDALSVEKSYWGIDCCGDNSRLITVVFVEQATSGVALAELIVGILAESQLVHRVLDVVLSQHVADKFPRLSSVVDALNVLNNPIYQVAVDENENC